MSSTDPSVHCDCRAVSVRRAIVVSIVVGLAAAVARSAVFRDAPAAQAACGTVAGLAVAAYGIARLYDRDRRLPAWVYAAVVLAGTTLATLWTVRLF